MPETKRKKLDDRGEKCIFIRSNEESKAYKLYNPLTDKVVVSRDVIFNEDKSWGWNNDITSKEKPLELEGQEEDVNYEGLERPPSTPHRYASSTDTSSIRSLGSISPSPTPIKMRGLDNIYAQTEETNLFFLNVDHEPFTFKEAVKENFWRNAIEEEKKKKKTWELTTLPPG